MKSISEKGEEKQTSPLMRIMGMAGAALWVLLILFCLLNRDQITVEGIVGYTPKNPVAAAILMLLLFCVKSVSLVFSIDLLYAASGVLFPLPAALTLNLCGTVLTVTIPYLLGKKLGSGAADEVVRRFPKAAVVREMRSENGFLFVLLVRFLGLPSDAVSLYMGAVRVGYAEYLPASLLGLLTHIVTFPVLGTSIAEPLSPPFLAAFGIQVAVTIASAVFAYGYRRRHQKKSGKEDRT